MLTMYTDYQSQFWAHALTLKSASDSVHNLSRSIANAKVDLDQQIKEVLCESQTATALTEKLAAQKRLKNAESERNKKRRELYDAQDAIDQQREALIAKIEGQLKMSENLVPLYSIRWTLA